MNKDTLKNARKSIDKSVSDVGKDLKAASAKLNALAADFNKELKHLNGSLADFNELLADQTKRVEQSSARMDDLQKKLTALSSEKIDHATLKLALEEEKKIYRQMISLITKNLEEKLAEIQSALEKIRNRPTPQAQTPEKPRTASNPPVPSQPGKILEQNLR